MKIIAFEGIDAAGKEMQSKWLANALSDNGYKVATESFPRYHLPTGKWIREALRGNLKLTPEAMHMLYEVDRQDYQPTLDGLEASGYDFLVLDRYTLSNSAFCMAKGMDLDWVASLQAKLRPPDLTLVLDISTETSIARKAVRTDMHELDSGLLTRARTAYTFLADKLSEIQGEDRLIYTVDGNRSPVIIFDEVLSLVLLNFGGDKNDEV